RARVRLTRQRMVQLESLVEERTRELRHAKETAETAREEIARERTRFKFIFESLPVGVTWMVRGRMETHLVNPEHERITGISAGEGRQMERYRDVTHPEDWARELELHQQLDAGHIDRYSLEKRYVRGDGSNVWGALTVRSFHDPATGEQQEISTLIDITGRKRAEAELAKIHQQLLNASRRAGMAEVATSVLHNVGNVLNSVNVSATLVADQLRKTKAVNLAKVAALLEEHKADLADFLTRDARGTMIPDYLGTLATALTAEQKTMLEEVTHLRKNIEHIKDIVTMQQSNARSSGVAEIVSIVEMVDDAIRINASSLVWHGVTVTRDLQAQGTITTDKHKVMQILINLVRNAKQACDESGRTEKQITIRTRYDEHALTIAIGDNGVGIPAENLTRIFNHGFTTRKDGHGFGLHSGALAAKELGGSLSVQSDGSGLGATFILELPLKTATPAHALSIR
ncbi:MAG: ATP-binding protein, partial [Opitutaceae bacterium]